MSRLAILKKSKLLMRSNLNSEPETKADCDVTFGFGLECWRIQIQQYGVFSIEEIDACQ